MTTLIINEESVKEEHFAWTSLPGDNEDIHPVEIVLVTYRHPQAPDHAFVQQYETRIFPPILRMRKKRSSHLILMESVQEIFSQIEESRKNEN